MSERDIARFHSKVDRSGGSRSCWEWRAGRYPEGYGEFFQGSRTNNTNRMYSAHRIAYKIANGAFPFELLVCHTCDNPPCCNPKHLWLGTDEDNARDKVKKGRENNYTGNDHWSRKKPHLLARGRRHGAHLHPERIWKGVQCHKAKLTEELVIKLRADYAAGGISYKSLGGKYGVTGPNARFIVIRHTWKHVP